MKKVPELRFPCFKDEWRLTDLKHSCEVNPNNTKLPESFYYIDLEAVQKGLLVKEPTIINREDAPSRAQRVLRPSDILFQTVRPYQKNNYIFKSENDLKTVASTGYAQLRAKNNYPGFIYHYIHNTSFVNKVLSRCTGTSYPAINSTDLGNVPIYLPSLPEQQKIADFFSTLDSRIETQEEKIRNLEDQKKGYMQRIFSQEIRFKDENGEDYPEWEEKRLGEFIRLQGGYAFKSSEYTDSGVPIIRISNIYKKINHEDDIVYSEEIEIDEKFIIKSGDLLIAMSGATTGKIGIYMYNTNSYLNQRVGKFVKKSNDLFYSYLYHLMESDLYIKQLKQRLIAGAQPNISPSDLESMEFIFPSFTEQQKIANFLSLFDEKIDIERKILDTLQEMKRGFLQKMFV